METEDEEMMYFCEKCERIFDEDEIDDGCPACHSEKIEACDYCEWCGQPVEPDLVFCEDCSERIKIAWDNMIHGLSKETRARYDDIEEFVCDWVEREVC